VSLIFDEVKAYKNGANIYTPLDRAVFLLQLCCWKFSHKETLIGSRLYSIELEFYTQKNKQFVFESLFWGS